MNRLGSILLLVMLLCLPTIGWCSQSTGNADAKIVVASEDGEEMVDEEEPTEDEEVIDESDAEGDDSGTEIEDVEPEVED